MPPKVDPFDGPLNLEEWEYWAECYCLGIVSGPEPPEIKTYSDWEYYRDSTGKQNAG